MNLGSVYKVVRAGRGNEWLYAVVNVPAAKIIMYSRTPWHARAIARWFNEWDTMPAGDYPYDGSQWEVDPA